MSRAVRVGGREEPPGSPDGGGAAEPRAAISEVPAGAVFASLDTSPPGLPSERALERAARYGANELPRPRRRGLWRQFAGQFRDLFAVVLLAASAITFLSYALERPRDVGHLQLGVAILGVVLLNALIGFTQEYAAERTAEMLQRMVPHTCRVLRDGQRRELAARELVPGDVVLLEAGDAVPADCRLVESHEVAVNNASLTGESDAVGRTDEPVAAGPPLQARNCVFLGTDVVAGSARAVVFATGLDTEFGRIFRLTAGAPARKSPLQDQVAGMARRVALAALACGVLLFAVRLPAGEGMVSSFVFALGVMVALVPEGLPATLSVTLSFQVRRMARRHALVKRLLAVEALGSTTVICTDKTGTLTQAAMTVTMVWTAGRAHPVSGIGYAPEGEAAGGEPVRELLRAAGLCGNARLLPPEEHRGWRVLGDPTEGALVVAATKAGLDLRAEESATPRTAEFPFDSVRKLMTTVHACDGGAVHRAHVKGSTQAVLARSDRIRWDADQRPLTEEARAEVVAAHDELAAQGLRVLAVGTHEVSSARPAQDEAESRLTFLGLVGMNDPPRPEVGDAVAACQRAGIRIIMLTGDHPLTAESIARRVGVVSRSSPAVLTGDRLDALDEPGLDALLADDRTLLLCRVSPEHKTRVVAALQRRGEVVAVTGDGANDAPALRRADIGVAMGLSGTDVAREAAAMVLLDDSFASIAVAVELGRSVYGDIRKFLVYLFSHNVAELVPILAATFSGFPLVPITAVQILAIDLGSDVLPALALGTDPPEPDVMDRPPRGRREPLFSAAVVRRFLFLGTIQAAGACAVFFWRVHSSGIPFADFTADDVAYREAITMTQASIVVSQFFNAQAVRTERESVLKVGLLSNPRLLLAGLLGIALMAAISYAPPLQSVFHTAALSATDWLVLVGLGALLLVAEETRKWLLRRGRTDEREVPR
ncbi:cation-transporting P-type ATPase [Streptomyces sp. B6B3]|uniref:cation-translocating P-type ATPase n=1 Tax=Streptomyces sp. B6B3 TaxID=3153570 RepID=UPI00325DDC06